VLTSDKKNNEKTKAPRDYGEVIGMHDDYVASLPSPIDDPHVKIGMIQEEKKDIKKLPLAD
jgi:hypothetical protein